MKFLFSLLILTSISAEAATGPSTVHFALTNWDESLATNYLNVKPPSIPITYGAPLVIGLPRSMTNGSTKTMFPGNYTVEIQNMPFQTPIRFTVPDDAGSYEFTSLITTGAVTTVTAPYFVLATDGNATNLSLHGTFTLPAGDVGYVWTQTNSDGSGAFVALGGFTGDFTVLTNGINTSTLHITNGLIMTITAP